MKTSEPVKKSLIIISAPSGAGKTTLGKRLLEDFPILKQSISSTTRPPRANEIHGKDYLFVPLEEFKKGIEKDHFAEWAHVHGHYYGTSKAVIERAFKEGHRLLLVIDVQGAKALKTEYPETCFSVFITPPSLYELENRLRSRGTDSEETIRKRLQNAGIEMKESSRFDTIIVNDSLERAYQELKTRVKEKLHLHLKE